MKKPFDNNNISDGKTRIAIPAGKKEEVNLVLANV